MSHISRHPIMRLVLTPCLPPSGSLMFVHIALTKVLQAGDKSAAGGHPGRKRRLPCRHTKAWKVIR
jgi:hypothetical protein